MEEEQVVDASRAPNLLAQFLYGVENALEGFSEALRECDPGLSNAMINQKAKIQGVRQQNALMEEMCREFHQHNADYYDRIKKRDESVIWEDKYRLVPSCPEISMRRVWTWLMHPSYAPDVREENEQVFWPYLQYANQFARLWNKIPPVILNQLERYAETFAKDPEVQKGNFAGKGMQIARFSQRLLKKNKKHVIDELTNNLVEIYQGAGGAEAISAMKQSGLPLSERSETCLRFFSERQEKGYSTREIAEQWAQEHPDEADELDLLAKNAQLDEEGLVPEGEDDETDQIDVSSGQAAEKKKKSELKKDKKKKKKKAGGLKKKHHGNR